MLSRLICLSVSLVVAICNTWAEEQAVCPDGRLNIVLQGALLHNPENGLSAQNRKDLSVIGDCRQGIWQEVWGHALRFNKSLHVGSMRGHATDTGLELDLAMRIRGDAWVEGGAGRWQLRIQLAADGTVSGQYRGQWAYGPAGPIAMTGTISGQLSALPVMDKDYVPFAADEFPRLLFRQADLPRLRQRLATPFGQAVKARLEASGNPVGLGVLYQLTEDKRYAEKAQAGVRKTMQETGGGAFAVGRVWGYRAERVAYAYDLCNPAWPDDFRKEVEDWLDWIVPRCIDRPWSLSSAVNITPGSNYMVVIWAGSALGAITRIGSQQGDLPAPPEHFAKARLITAPAWQPNPGVPVNHLQDGVMPEQWLWSGGLLTRSVRTADAFKELGGADGYYKTIADGKSFTIAGQTVSFQSVAKDHHYRCGIGKFTAGLAMDLSSLYTPTGGKKEESYDRSGWMFAAVKVDKPTPVRLLARGNNATALGALWVSGQRLEHGDVCTLATGTHPVLIEARSLDLIPNPWGKMLFEPRFMFVEEATLPSLLAGRAIELDVRRRIHADEVVASQTLPGWNWEAWRLARRGARWNMLNCQGSMGDGGFQAEGEGYTRECHRPLIGYASVHRHAFGTALSSRPDASHFAPRYVATSVYHGIDAKGRGLLSNLTWGGGHGTIEANYLGRCMPLCPPEWQANLLWFWHRRAGIPVGQDKDLQQTAVAAVANWPAGINLVYAFLHYPLELQAAPPAEGMPLHWAATGKGFHSFRNRYDDSDDIVMQVYAKGGKGAGWSAAEAGGFQLYGLGHAWAVKAKHDRGGGRQFENVVMLPDVETASGARAQVRSVTAGSDGSGVVHMDLDSIYRVAKAHPTNAKRRIWVDGGIRGWRAVGVDYSERSGAAASFAVLDRITGPAGKREWTMHIPNFSADAVQVNGRVFEITKGDARLTGTVVAPADARIVVGEQAGLEAKVGAGRKHRNGKVNFTRRGLRVISEDPDAQDVFVVLTLQRGAAPVVQVTDAGRTATVGTLVWRVQGDALLRESVKP